MNSPVAACSAAGTLLLYLLVSTLAFRDRWSGERFVAGISASLVNSTNLGLPIAAYVLGDIRLAAPVIAFQLAIYTPLYIILLDQVSGERNIKRRSNMSAKNAKYSRRLFTTLNTFVQSAANPIALGALMGLLFSWKQWRVPDFLDETLDLVGGAAVPLLLLSFGLSLVGNKPLSRSEGRRLDVLIAAVFKLVLHPLLAYLTAVLFFQLEGPALLAAVVMAGLPSAQNVFVAAIRYGTGEITARDTVLVTTVLAAPTIALFVVLL
ncbi:AEC family transporter [Nesterenkonia alkaliphila]|uniref:AEC family transporter n=1 Tax=Nesterenkonia alkaliphila TaxID=1463631 RepID=A0A7K1ULY9_9MICC|nr:AEC family transporter [Nesterenkonia alkaliphila]MVT27495.1 AEC family transporter [Nesterenkonia alkaliphila]GFZ94853.1 permease [Nesterenkonia alkaliphila]